MTDEPTLAIDGIDLQIPRGTVFGLPSMRKYRQGG
jgi:hypothetical protein